jgi:hypothetical protein
MNGTSVGIYDAKFNSTESSVMFSLFLVMRSFARQLYVTTKSSGSHFLLPVLKSHTCYQHLSKQCFIRKESQFTLMKTCGYGFYLPQFVLGLQSNHTK